ncbi:histidinol-phosphate aminotransferase [Salinisphaera orenii MK-B5]|uniref:Histidinol-phosphate aminotransferase n=1 Tax=Salinisphaera orenii MK-B5 TaxID=856730 RepID=A0A423PRU5_9GAMM|nr:histidinol-phosphate transaminase [Salinisphaera orenii]ROO28307.1 histidinol-phosphate aminotransferase [Salinisphaera orenii MK-B5]
MSLTLTDQAHAGIRSLHAYEPGKPIEDLKRELGLSSIIKLASNENPLGTAPAATRALAEFAGELHRYPDGNGFALKQKLAARHAIEPGRITLGNGSNDVLELTARVFLGPGKNAVFSEYAFAVYPIVARAVNAETRVVPALGASAEMPRGHDLDAFMDHVDDNTGVVFIASPNNPTGTWLAPAAIEAFLDALPAHVVVVLDEAYLEYQDRDQRPDSRAWLERYPNLIVTRTFSKIYGMAGLRVGYGLSSPEVADYINRVRQPFNVSTIGLHCAEAALDDKAFIDRSIGTNTVQRAALAAELQARGLSCLPSQANFITFDCGEASTPLFQAMLREGVIVRPLASYDMPEHLRVTVGAAEDNARFLAALDVVRDRG